MVSLNFYEMAGLLTGSILLHHFVASEFHFFSIIGGATVGAIIIVSFKLFRKRASGNSGAPGRFD